DGGVRRGMQQPVLGGVEERIQPAQFRSRQCRTAAQGVDHDDVVRCGGVTAMSRGVGGIAVDLTAMSGCVSGVAVASGIAVAVAAAIAVATAIAAAVTVTAAIAFARSKSLAGSERMRRIERDGGNQDYRGQKGRRCRETSSLA